MLRLFSKLKGALIFGTILLIMGKDSGAVESSTLPDCPGEEVRLDQPGMPLEHSPVQDQDGLGICYASSSTLLIQAALKGHPEVSAIDLAVNTYKKDQEKNKGGTLFYTEMDSKGKPVGKPELFINAGLVCEAFNSAKVNGVCPRNHSSIESSSGTGGKSYSDEMSAQSEILNETAHFISGMSAGKKKNPSFDLKLRESAPALRTIYQKNLNDHLGAPGSGDHLLAFQLGLLDKAYPNSVSSNLDQRTKAEAELRAFFISDPKFPGGYLTGIRDNKSSRSLMDQEYASLSDYPELIKLLRDSESQMGSAMNLDKMHERIANPTYAFLKDSEAYFQSNKNGMGCDAMAHIRGNLATLSKTYGSVGAFLEFQNFLNGLENADVNLVLGAIAPKCLDGANRIKIPENLQCLSSKVPTPDVIRDKKGKILNYEAIRKPVRQKLLWSLMNHSNPRPVSIGICSGVFSYDDVMGTFDQPAACKKLHPDTGPHQVTVIGARKNKASGSCEYLIQNSWGSDCGSMSPRLQKECEVNHGKVWLDEKVLVTNVDEIVKIVEKPAK
jgi:hypothetical protein